ncbi:TIGR04140 family protein [Thermococcus sp. MAR1]|nr:TIGR04140 family protein [Thermococcus sp. MAR1]
MVCTEGAPFNDALTSSFERSGGSSLRIVETPIPLSELEEIREKSGAEVKLTYLGKIERNGITLNRVLVEGSPEEIERFMEKLRLARAGG